MENLPESELVVLAKRGDELAFTKLLNDNLPKIKVSIQSQYKLNSHDLDDIIQIATVKAWQKFGNFMGTSTFLTWLYVIIRNESLNFLKKRHVIDTKELPSHKPSPDGEDDEDYEHILESSLDDGLSESAQAILIKREEIKAYKDLIECVLNKLTPSHSQIIRMVLEEDKSYKEIAQTLNVPIGTVMSRLYFARRHAQKLLKQYAPIYDAQLYNMGRCE